MVNLIENRIDIGLTGDMRRYLSCILSLVLLLPALAWGEAPTGTGDAPVEKKSDIDVQGEAAAAKIPDGTMAPITLRATLQKTKDLVVTFDQILRLSAGKSVEIDIANENTRLQEENYFNSLSNLLPSITVQNTNSHYVGGQIIGGNVLPVTRTTFQPEFLLNYTLYTGGSNIFTALAARRTAIAQKELGENTKQNQLMQVAQGYYNLQIAYWQRAIALEAVQDAQKQVDLAAAQYKNGIGLKLTLIQAQANLSTAQGTIVTAESAASTASNHLAQLLNLDYSINLVPAILESNITKIVPEGMTSSKLLAIAKIHNPNIKAMQDLIVAGKQTVRSAIMAIFPQLNITAYKSWVGGNSSDLIGNHFAGVVTSFNLLQNMGTAAPIAMMQAKTNAHLAELNLQEANRLMEEDFANQIVNLKALEESIEVDKQTLNYAKEAYDQAFGRLKEGIGTYIDLENAQNTLTQARSSLANAFLSYDQAEVQLLADLGVISTETLQKGFQLPAS
jgi:outer membrane protein TolC